MSQVVRMYIYIHIKPITHKKKQTNTYIHTAVASGDKIMGNVLDCAADKPENEDNFSTRTTNISFDNDSDAVLQSEDPVVIQELTRLSSPKNVLWDLQKNFYKDVGEEAWTQGIVPNFVSSNAFIAKCYAKVIVEFANEWFSKSITMEDGSVCEPDLNEPIYILEIGSGSGKLAYLLMNQIMKLCRFFPRDHKDEQGVPFRIIVSDVARRNLEYWFTHSKLKPLFDQGLLEAALIDGEVIGDEITLSSGKVLSKSTLKNPIICVANYVFNTLSHDALQIQPDGVYVGSVRTKSTATTRLNINNETVDAKPFEIIQGMKTEWSYKKVDIGFVEESNSFLNRNNEEYDRKVNEKGLYGNDPILNSLPHQYFDLVTGIYPKDNIRHLNTAEDATILIPIGGLKLLQNLTKICDDANVSLLSLIGDKGYSSFNDMAGLRNPHIAKHGSFSFMVNFHALSMYAAKSGGFMLQGANADGFKCCLIGSNKLSVNKIPMTCLAFNEWANGFGPESFSTLQRCDRDESISPGLKHAIAMVRLANNDAEVFHKFKSTVIDKVGALKTSESVRKDLRKTLKGVLENYFPLQPKRDVSFEVARVYMGLKDYRTSIRLFDASTNYCGAHHVTYHNQGICYFYLEDYDNAITKFEESLTLKDTYHEARKWLEKAKLKVNESAENVVIEEDEMDGTDANSSSNNDGGNYGIAVNNNRSNNNKVLNFNKKKSNIMVV